MVKQTVVVLHVEKTVIALQNNKISNRKSVRKNHNSPQSICEIKAEHKANQRTISMKIAKS